MVDHISYVGLVNAHSKSNRGNNDMVFVGLPFALNFYTFRRLHASMVVESLDAKGRELCSY
jgi:hypothetical protein